MFQLLGSLVRYFPSVVGTDEDQLVRMLVRVADGELLKHTRKPELPLAAGALAGLQHVLHSFPELGGEGTRAPAALQRKGAASVNVPQYSE